jgi:hypothetical protein
MSRDTQLGMGGDPNSDPIDRILASEEPLVPSSGFLATVMEKVREEAAAPAPIPFPWRRALPGAILALCILGYGAYVCLRYAVQNSAQLSLTLPNLSVATGSVFSHVGWVAFALVISLLSWILASRMVRGSGLF